MKVFKRKEMLSSLKKSTFDLLIVGGGVTGAGIALDAASRGLKTALIEKKDFASGTSSKSTKLFHGGLRYLKNLEFGLVRKFGKERAILNKNAPHLAYPQPMLLPFYKKWGLSSWKTILGVFLYELLAGVKKSEKFQFLSGLSVLKKEPLLNSLQTTGGCFYTEYQTNDSRLVIELIKTSLLYDSSCLNYIEANSLLLKKGVVSGVLASDLISGSRFKISARSVINATGPWIDSFLEKTNSESQQKLFLTKGVHVVFKKTDFPLKKPVYFPVQDGRMVFAIPRLNLIYVGTTDTPFNKNPDNIVVEKKDVIYLLDSIKKVFSVPHLSAKHVVSSWAGIRPLVFGKGENPSEISRKDEVFVSKNKLITIAGGKLSGYRMMAEKATDLVFKNLRLPFVKSKTKNITLVGGDFNAKTLFDAIEKKVFKMGGRSIDAEYLFYTYGSQSKKILNYMKKQGVFSIELDRAEKFFTKKYEAVVFENDHKKRRTQKAFFPL